MKEIRETEEFKAWFAALRDNNAKTRIDVRIKRLSMGNSGDSRFLDDISEMRIDYGPGYRVYYKDTGREIIILLCGGDKRTQSRDIGWARELLRNLEV
ncbi:MAG: type II toxin-antitoxin system RelE/ParE family toxin [Lachnoclostridium sp.]|jgi:putative addiction module killer protein|nr:type II toxin-antitoxin system RelE/ParE family toxin [Lachnoclostridium sp.]